MTHFNKVTFEIGFVLALFFNKWFIATKALRHKGAERRATSDAIHYVPLPLCAYLTYINFGFVLV
jgi:hypothetical protein